jgi:hypothetical protein
MNPLDVSLLCLMLAIAARPVVSFVKMVMHRAEQGPEAPRMTLH